MDGSRRVGLLLSDARVESVLLRCAEWSRTGRHRRVLTEVERLLPLANGNGQLRAHLLIWKAQALLAMSCADRAEVAARESWDLEASPHACHLMANALFSLGDGEQSEQLLHLGWRLFPEAVHLPVQLTMMLADQGRLAEALQILDELPQTDGLPHDLQVFVLGLRANLLATVGRWAEASQLLEHGLDLHPESALLHETHDTLNHAWTRSRTEHELVASWSEALEQVEGVAAEVDDAIVRCGEITERSRLEVLAARRLWRAYLYSRNPRPQAPEPWGAAALLAVAELDGEAEPAAVMARCVGANATTVRSALRNLRCYLAELQPEFARRSFAAYGNPRLEDGDPLRQQPDSVAAVLDFPLRSSS